jgi:hypothetical protein
MIGIYAGNAHRAAGSHDTQQVSGYPVTQTGAHVGLTQL